jgi:muramoyltetrapeptide carboxypeptidase
MYNKPDRLRSGDKIGIVSPCWLLEQSRREEIERVLAIMGFRAVFGSNAFRSTDGYAASVQERADDFNSMIDDPAVRMILFSGGEVGDELLPLLDYAALTRKPKLLCSYSDGTNLLNAVTSLGGIVTYYGQCWNSLLYSEHNRACFLEAFRTDSPPAFRQSAGWYIVTHGTAEGILIGGYLANFALMVGSPYFRFSPEQRHLLFLEDHISFTSPPAFSRYLSHIAQSRLFETVTGVLIGHYDTAPSPELDAVLTRFAASTGLPVVRCDDFGHGTRQNILPIGLPARLDTQAQSLVFAEAFTR